jgi:hypothetical protein
VKTLLPHEVVVQMRTGVAEDREVHLVTLTDHRVIMLSKGLYRDSSSDFLPLNTIASVTVDGGLLMSDLILRTTLGRSRRFAISSEPESFANAIRAEVARATMPPPPPPPAPEPTPAALEPDVLDQLTRLGQLRDAGVLTEEEFTAKKTELLRRL